MSLTTVAIAGIGESDLGAAPAGTRPVDLMLQAAVRALDDCGLTPSDVDGVFAACGQLSMPALDLALGLGVQPRFTDGTNVGGASFMFHLAHAQMAIATGQCDVALVAYGSTARLDRAPAMYELDPWEAPYSAMEPIASYALAAARHAYEFGTTREQLAAVAVSGRKWASVTPGAWSQTDLTIDDVLSSKMISTPLTVRDCCLVTDGGAAVVLTSLTRAKDLRRPPVAILGAGQSHSHRHISGMPDLTTTSAVQSGSAAFAQARLKPEDIDCIQLYDAFTITPLLFLEDLGFCEKGEAGAFVQDGNTVPGGSLPMNTNGGGLAYGHPGMYGLFAIVEATRQLRGGLGARQVPDCSVVLAHGNGGVLSAEGTVILGTLDTVG